MRENASFLHPNINTNISDIKLKESEHKRFSINASIYKTKIHQNKGCPLILKGGPGLEMLFIVLTFHSLANHCG